jgi:TolB-like protein/DNA-binding winged helix-turn-helix (wHTH) protein/Flp pilus assembly protein TadD
MIYRFGNCEIDVARFRLRRDGRTVAVEPQVLQLLVYLIDKRHRVVTRQELFDAIWNGRVVSDSALNSRIKAARAAVGDDGRTQSIIRTFHRRGYRFVGTLNEDLSPRLQTNPDGSADVGRIVAAADALDELELTLPDQPSVAVLPFRAIGDSITHGIFADGLTHDIITQIARARWLFVVARGSAFRFRAGPYDPRDIGRALGVRYVVQGEIQFLGGRVGVYVSLTDTLKGMEHWAEHFDRKLDQLVAVQAEIAEAVVGAVEAEIETAERERSLLKSPASLDAWGAYHRGCWHMYRFTPQDYEQAEHFFRRSIELDPEAPRAYAGLSFIHWQRAFLELTKDRRSEEERALEFAFEGLSKDPRDPLGHWALGRAYLLQRELDQAVDELEMSVQLNPSSAVGQYTLAYGLMQIGEAPRSNDIVAKARRLSPYDAMTFAMYAVRAQNFAFLGRYPEAATFATRAARQPNSHYQVVAIAAFCNMLAGRTDTARQFYSQLLATRPGYGADDYLKAFNHRPDRNSTLVRKTFGQLEALT